MLKFNNQTNVIGIGGVARVGKDTLAKILKQKLEDQGFRCKIDHFAAPLKKEADEFLIQRFGISSFTQDDREKAIIRPFLVGLAEVFRKQTKGEYFWRKLKERNENLEDGTILIIPDLRFAWYRNDEINFVNANGRSIHLRLFRDGKMVQPANHVEHNNDKHLIKECLVHFSWGATKDPASHWDDKINLMLERKILPHIKRNA